MRALIPIMVCGLVACGGAKKPANDPATSETASTANEDTPKWDSSSESSDTAKRSKELSASAGSDTSSTSATPAAPPKQRRSDEYDKEATEVVLKRAARQVKQNCGAATDEDGKASGPWGQGSMRLVLGHNGHLKEAAIGSPFEGKPTGRCAVQAFSRLTYPPWAGSDMNLDWPVELVPPTAAPKK